MGLPMILIDNVDEMRLTAMLESMPWTLSKISTSPTADGRTSVEVVGTNGLMVIHLIFVISPKNVTIVFVDRNTVVNDNFATTLRDLLIKSHVSFETKVKKWRVREVNK